MDFEWLLQLLLPVLAVGAVPVSGRLMPAQPPTGIAFRCASAAGLWLDSLAESSDKLGLQLVRAVIDMPTDLPLLP